MMLCCAMLCYVVLCCAMLCCAMMLCCNKEANDDAGTGRDFGKFGNTCSDYLQLPLTEPNVHISRVLVTARKSLLPNKGTKTIDTNPIGGAVFCPERQR